MTDHTETHHTQQPAGLQPHKAVTERFHDTSHSPSSALCQSHAQAAPYLIDSTGGRGQVRLNNLRPARMHPRVVWHVRRRLHSHQHRWLTPILSLSLTARTLIEAHHDIYFLQGGLLPLTQGRPSRPTTIYLQLLVTG